MGDSLPWQLQSLCHSVMASCSYGNPRFLHLHSLLQIASLLPPQHVSSQVLAAFLGSALQFSHSSTQLPCALVDTHSRLGCTRLWHWPSRKVLLCHAWKVVSLSFNSPTFSPSVITDLCISEKGISVLSGKNLSDPSTPSLECTASILLPLLFFSPSFFCPTWLYRDLSCLLHGLLLVFSQPSVTITLSDDVFLMHL